MFSLIITIIALLLFVAVLVAGINYIPASTVTTKETTTIVQSGNSILANALYAYRVTHDEFPEVTGWDTTLFPNYGKLPLAPSNMAWSYGTNGTGHYVCVSGSIDKSRFDGISAAQGLYSDEYYVSDACGAEANGAIPSAYPAAIAATFWVTSP